MDNLAFTYIGNQLQTVTDSWDTQEGFEDGNTVGADYTYDANGNRIIDKNKGITAYKYNYMNQREKVTFSDGNYLLYIYDAMGNKLSQGVYNSSNVLQKKTDYVGEFFYENDTLKYISHEEGRYNVLAGAYEYELRDHLGNNRVTFTTKEEHDQATATMETANLTAEQGKFLRYENARRISSHLFDKTNGNAPNTTPGYSVRLSGSANERFGLARSFAVVPGDTVKAEVYVKYIDSNSSNWTTALNTLLTQIAGGTAPAGTVVDGGSYGSSTTSFPYAGLLNTSGSSGTGPKAYLNWLVFDNNFVLVNGGFVRMSDVAREYGQDCAHEYLSAEIPIITSGFVYVYLSNENESIVDVFYDQFSVELRKSPVINATDLYPYGAPAISYSREFSLKQDRLLNGKETQDELGYNVVDLGQRDIDPFVPVFPTIDRFAEKYGSMSPYQYAAGNPVAFVDINGDSLWISFGNNQRALYNNGQLQNADGSRYEGEGVKVTKKGKIRITDSYLSAAVGALNAIGSTDAGAGVINTLQSSENNFTVKQGADRFMPGDKGLYAKYMNEAQGIRVLDEGKLVVPGLPFNKVGSGGIIYWDPADRPMMTTPYGDVPSDPTISMAHEMFHAYDANFGFLDYRKVSVNGGTEERHEIRAVHFQNQVAGALRKSLRSQYTSGGATLLNKGQPVNVSPPSITWLQHIRFR